MHGESGDGLREELLSAVLDDLSVIAETNDVSGLSRPEAEERVAGLETWLDEHDYADLYVCQILGWMTWYRAHLDPAGSREPRMRRAVELLLNPYANGVSHLPQPLLRHLADAIEDVAVDRLRQVFAVDEPELLAHTVTLWQRIVADTPLDSPDRAARLSHLAGALHQRALRAGSDADVADLDSAIELLTAAAAARQEGAPSPGDLSNLGQILLTRYRLTRTRGDLDAAIVRIREAAAVVPDSPSFLVLLGSALRERFAATGDPSDLTDALACLRTADRVAPRDHHERGTIHANLGSALLDLAARTHLMSDLDEAIAQFDLALAHTPEGHASREQTASLRAKAQEERDRGHEARELLQLMTERIPPVPGPIPGQNDDDPASTLMGVGGMCRLRSQVEPDPEGTHWLDMAIAYYRAALATAEPGHPRRADMLSLLGTALAARGPSGPPTPPDGGAAASGSS
ncbi:hypothetical protein ACFU8I_22880 [Streptomyces sp. NPDC057540]|uniref:hypothetical protein n=1 Tax=Streptomyces sp. NPDC057540 TaxID=3346160 RepID=UPI003697C5DB